MLPTWQRSQSAYLCPHPGINSRCLMQYELRIIRCCQHIRGPRGHGSQYSCTLCLVMITSPSSNPAPLHSNTYSYSVYATRAKGARFVLCLVILLTAAFLLCSGVLFPYVPTILASALVLFFGIVLLLEAIWAAFKTLALMEYAVVLGTLAGTFLGFAEGFGVGISAAAAVYLMYGLIDSPARVAKWNEMQQLRIEDGDHVAAPRPSRGGNPPRTPSRRPRSH
ncbi:hypothetical protein K438DRAFT_444887 [Mycena galopus ATCC 62051]|nr:hypothetical protein K438DRAFT_444887 [Mycena galopus ATCC 62051]